MAEANLGLGNSGVPASASAVLAGYYRTAAKQLAAVVVDPPGGTEGSRAYRQSRAADQLNQVRRVQRKLDQLVSAWTGEAITTAYRAGRELGRRQVIEVGLEVDPAKERNFAMIGARSAAVFAADTFETLKAATTGMAQRVESVLRKAADVGLSRADLNRILAGGVITGERQATIRQLRDELEAINGDKVTVVGKDGVGRDYDVGYYAEMVARTQTRQATVAARHERLQESDIDLVQVIGRNSDNFCTAFVPRVFSLSGKSSQYPSIDEIDGGPPFHPNCSKSTRAFIPELASARQLELAKGVDGSEKLFGLKGYARQRAFKDLQLGAKVSKVNSRSSKDVFGRQSTDGGAK